MDQHHPEPSGDVHTLLAWVEAARVQHQRRQAQHAERNAKDEDAKTAALNQATSAELERLHTLVQPGSTIESAHVIEDLRTLFAWLSNSGSIVKAIVPTCSGVRVTMWEQVILCVKVHSLPITGSWYSHRPANYLCLSSIVGG